MEKTVHRPWGTFQILDQGEGYWIKKIEVLMGQQLSLQYHENRDERWTIIQGMAEVTLNNVKQLSRPGGTVIIGKKDIHRIKNVSNIPLIFIEVALGDCKEEDIKRLADDFGRVDKT